MRLRRFLSVILAMAMIAGMLPAVSVSAIEIDDGYCGDNLTWVVTSAGELTISGSGTMTDYGDMEEAPWRGYSEMITSVVVEDGVTSVGNSAFSCCYYLECVELPDGLLRIGNEAFSDCSVLTSIDIPSTVTEIGEGAFSYCSCLTDVELPEGLTQIEEYLFSCSGLTGIVIPDGVTSIGTWAFERCFDLEEVYIPASVISIGYNIFYLCKSLQGIYVDSANTEFCSDEFGVMFNKEKTQLIKAPCSIAGCYEVPETVQTISENAFYYADSMTGVTIGDSVVRIDTDAFRNCSALTEITIPKSVVSVSDYAFYDCTSLTKVTFAGDAPELGQRIFNNVTAEVYYPSENETWTADVMLNYGGTITWIAGGEEEPVTVVANGTCGDQLMWTLTENGVLTLSGTGDMEDYSYESAPWYSYSNQITSVVIAEGVTGIGDYAFQGCTGLVGVSIPESVRSIGTYAFLGCTSLTQIRLPEGLTEISEGMLALCGSLEEIAIPSGVTSIGSFAFQCCAGLTEVTIPGNVTTISEYAFSFCTGLTEIRIPDSVTYIDDYAFCDSIGLTEITFTGDAPEDGYNMFFNVTATAYYPANNGTWTEEVMQFYGGTIAWVAVDEDDGNDNENETDDSTIFLDTPTTVEVATGGQRTEFVFVPKQTDRYVLYSIGSLDPNCYLYDSQGNQLSYQDDYNNRQFRLEYELIAGESYYFSVGLWGSGSTGNFDVILEIAHDYQGGSCIHCGEVLYKTGSCGENLTWTLEGDYVLTISGYGDMYNYTGYGWSVDEFISETAITVDGFAPWYTYHSQITAVVIEDGVTGVGSFAFYGLSNLYDICLPEGVTYIGSYALGDCYGLQVLQLPNSVTEIGGYAFSYCYSLTTVELPAGLTKISDGMLSWCSGLTQITIPKDVTQIGEYAFSGCGMTEVRLSDSVTFIGEYAFDNCQSLTSFEIPAGVTQISEGMLSWCSNLTQITIPEGVTYIGSFALSDCSGLTQLQIPESVEFIGDYAFAYCYGLRSIELPEGLTEISSGMLAYCDALEQITIPSTVTRIADYAFDNCFGLTGQLTIPDSVHSIELCAFYGCTGITSIYFGSGLAEIGTSGYAEYYYSAFYGCTGVTQITFTNPEVPLLHCDPFTDMTALEFVYVPVEAYADYEELLAYYLPDGVALISMGFEGDFLIQNGVLNAYFGPGGDVVIPDGVIRIGTAFKENTNITSITLPEGLSGIDAYAFYGCNGLSSITFMGTAVPSVGSSAFYGTTALKTVYVPAAAYDAYVSMVLNQLDEAVTVIPMIGDYTPANLRPDGVYSHSVVLSWDVYPGAVQVSYCIYRDGVCIGTTTESTFIDRSLQAGVSYSYAVQLCTDDGQISELATLSVTTAEPEVLDIFTDYPGNVIDDHYSTVYVSIADHGNLAPLEGTNTVLSLYIRQDDRQLLIGQAVCAAGVTEYAFAWDITVMEDGEFTLIAALADADGGCAQYCETVTIDRDYPDQIVGVSAFGDVASIYINWAISAEVDTAIYRIYRRAENEEAFSLLVQINNRNTLSYTDNTADSGTIYYYYVAGVDSLGREGEGSVTVGATLAVDDTAPRVTKLTPTAGSYLSGTVTFTLTAEDNVDVVRAEIYYSVDDGITWELLAQMEKGNFRATLDTTALSDGVIRVEGIAYDAAGNESGALTYVYCVDNTGPQQVQDLSYESTAITATLRWSNVPEEDAAYFLVEKRNSDGSYSVAATVYSTLGVNLYNLTPDSQYTYRVVAYDSQGNRGIPSQDITVTTASDTTNPVVTQLRPSAGYYSDSVALFANAWDDYNVASITLQLSWDRLNWTDLYTANYSDISASRTLSYTLDLRDFEEGSFYFRAIATDTAGNKSDSSVNAGYVQYIIDRQAPAAPESVTAAGGNGYILVSWVQGSESDLNSYSVYRAESEDGEYVRIAGGLRTINYYDRSAKDGVVYYYKVSVCDTAGNVSEWSSVATAEVAEDTQAPQVLAISPVSGTTVGVGNADVCITVSDNNSLARILIEYSLDGANYEILYEQTNISSYGNYSSAQLPVANVADGTVIYVRASAVDRAGNVSEFLYAQYTVDNTAPQVVSAETLFDAQADGVVIRWTGCDESDLVRYNIYRKEGTNGSYALVNYVYPIAGQTAYTYTDTAISSGSVTYTYKITATDGCGNTGEAFAPAVTVTDRRSPKPVISCDSTMEVGVEYLLDGTSSTDDSGIVRYDWDFGDGTTAVGSTAIHVYEKTGTYAVTLTVTDDNGNQASCSRTVNVKQRTQIGTVTVRVVDENGNPVPGASVYFDLGEDTQVIKITDGNGCAMFTAEVGIHYVGCFISDNEWLPAAKDVAVTANCSITTTMTMVHQTLIEGYFEVNRMTFEEIVAAGIDVTAPENQHIVKINVTITYGTSQETAETSFMFNMSTMSTIGGGGRIVYKEDGSPGGGGGGGGTRELIPAVFCNGNTEEDIAIAYLDVPIGASFLKEFFDVKLHILNNASSEFTMINNVINLNLPDGLTLMDTDYSSSSATVIINEIPGQSSETIRWIIRGDEEGSYNLSADYTGTLAVFNENVSTTFVSEEPLVVYGLSAIKLIAEINSTMYFDGFYFNLTMENVSDIDIYMPSLEVIGNTISTYLDYLDEEMDDVNSEPSVRLLNTLLTNASGYTRYIGTDTTVTTLAPGEAMTEKYAVYNAVGYNNMMYLKNAIYTVLEGFGVDFQIVVTDMDLYSTTNAAEKLAAIKSDFEKFKMYTYILGNYNYFYVAESLNRDSDFFTVWGEKCYDICKVIFSFDANYSEDEMKEITRKLVAQLLLDESVQQAVLANVDTKYLDVTEKTLSYISRLMASDEYGLGEEAKMLSDHFSESDNLRKLAKELELNGLDGFYGRLATVVGSTAITTVMNVGGSQINGVFSEAVSEACSQVSDVVEKIGTVVTAWNDAAELTTALFTIAAAQEEALDLLDMLVTYVDPETPVYDEIVTIQESLLRVQSEMSTQFISKLTESFIQDAMGNEVKAILQCVDSCYGTSFGAIYTMLKIAFGTLDYLFDWSGTLNDMHLLRATTVLSFALVDAAHEYDLDATTNAQALHTLKALKYVIKMRLIGEQAFVEIAKSNDAAQEFLDWVNHDNKANYESLDEYAADINTLLLTYRDTLFSTYYTTLDIPDAPEVSVNYVTGTTNEAFSSDYEYSFNGSTWYTCDGNVITISPSNVGSFLRVRIRSTALTLAGNTTSVVIAAKPLIMGDISVVYVGDAYRISGLDDGTYLYQFTDSKTLETLTGSFTAENGQTVILDEADAWTYLAIGTAATESNFASQIRYLVTEEKEVSQIVMDLQTLEALEGDMVQLTVQVLPEDALDRTVTWSSSDPSVVTVNEDGLLTAIHEGTAIITATANDGTNIQASCAVTVLHRHVYEEVVTDPTCTEDGYTTYTCHCGDCYTETHSATGHSFTDNVCGNCGKVGVTVTLQPESAAATIGQTVTFNVSASGDGLTYKWQWRKNASSAWASTSVSGNRTDTITVPVTAARNGYQYRCVITDAYGNVVYSDAVTLSARTALEILEQPVDVSATIGQTVTFNVSASGDGLTYKWQWRKNASSAWAGTSVSGNRTDTITVPVTAARNGYQYRCVITDAYGNVVYSDAVTLSARTALEILEQPVDVSATIGQTVTFNVSASGDGLTYKWQWRKNASSAWAGTSVSGNRTDTITVPVTAARNGYQYRCVITDAYGNVVYSDAVTLSARTALEILEQPVDVSATIGQTVTFNVSASGDGLTYKWQWRKNASSAWASTSVSGNRTDTITVPVTAARNGYQYRCVITDAYGNVVYSDAVTLSARTALEILEQPVDVSATIGKTVTFNVSASGDGLTYKWQWRKNASSAWAGTSVSGNRTDTITVPVTAARNGYQYRCVITDAYGNVVYSAAVTLTVK